jgi:hypothetical protein
VRAQGVQARRGGFGIEIALERTQAQQDRGQRLRDLLVQPVGALTPLAFLAGQCLAQLVAPLAQGMARLAELGLEGRALALAGQPRLVLTRDRRLDGDQRQR